MCLNFNYKFLAKVLFVLTMLYCPTILNAQIAVK